MTLSRPVVSCASVTIPLCCCPRTPARLDTRRLGLTLRHPRAPIRTLFQDEKFKKYVEIYAKDKQLFYDDFTKAFQTLEELGTKGLKPIPTA